MSLSMLSLSAQRRGGTPSKRSQNAIRPVQPQFAPHQYRERYDFAQAAMAYRELRTTTTDSLALDSLEQLIQACDKAETLLQSCQKIVFADSLVFDKTVLFTHLPQNNEIGYVVSTQQLFNQKTLGASRLGLGAYVNPLQSAAYFSLSKEGRPTQLYTAFSSSGIWTSPIPLTGLSDSLFQEADFPFLLTDGVTLYFSAKGPESIGGYDLFATRYNAAQQSYVHPYNVGMPFNSPANDYLLAFDAPRGIGYLLTDRQQAEGKVCLYTFFIPKEHHSLPEDLPRAERVAYAKISSLSHSQREGAEKLADFYRQGLDKQPQVVPPSSHFHFVVNDVKVYHFFEDFQSSEARTMAKQWHILTQQLEDLELQQVQQQAIYARTRQGTQRERLLQLEQQIGLLYQQKKLLEHNIRSVELKLTSP